MDEILNIKNLSLGFEIGEKFYPAIKNLSFDLERKTIHAIIGESGSGKTVSVMSILGLLPKNAKITGGEILYNNTNLLNLKEREFNKIRGAKIALIPQDPMTSLNPLYTIENQVTEGIIYHKKCSKKEAIEIALRYFKEVNINEPEKKLKCYPHELSGGLKQRVIIACALCLEPEIIIADEPTTALDVTVAAQILKLIEKIKESGKSIILISHDLGIVSNYADYISIVYKGRIIEEGKTKTIFKNPKHPYTKALIEALPYSKEKRLKNIKGQIPPITECISGCEFNPRCEYREEICREKIFKLENQPDNSKVACRMFSC